MSKHLKPCVDQSQSSIAKSISMYSSNDEQVKCVSSPNQLLSSAIRLWEKIKIKVRENDSLRCHGCERWWWWVSKLCRWFSQKFNRKLLSLKLLKNCSETRLSFCVRACERSYWCENVFCFHWDKIRSRNDQRNDEIMMSESCRVPVEQPVRQHKRKILIMICDLVLQSFHHVLLTLKTKIQA